MKSLWSGRLHVYSMAGAGTYMSKTPTAKRATVDVAARTAAKLTEAIANRWHKTDRELYEAADISSTSLTNLKTIGVETVTPSLKKICRELRISPEQLVANGEIVNATTPPTERPDLHDMLNALIGTNDEETVERLLRALTKVHAS